MRLVPAADKIELRRPAGGPAADEANRFDESRPMLGRRRGRLDIVQCRDRVGAFADTLQHFRRRRRPGARQQLDDAKTGDAVARILRPAQERQHDP